MIDAFFRSASKRQTPFFKHSEMNNIQSPQTNSHQTAEQLISDGRYKESKEISTKLLIEDPSDHVATHMLGLLAKKPINGT